MEKESLIYMQNNNRKDMISEIKEIPIDEIIDRETFQVRKWYNQKHIEALADSIKNIGLQSPIILRKCPEKEGYQLIAGETRTRAHELLQYKSILAKIVNLTDEQAERWSFESNLLHESGQLHPIEQGYFYKKLYNKNQSYEKIAKQFKVSTSTISIYISLTKLSKNLQNQMINELNTFTIQHALQIVRLADYDDGYQEEIWNQFQKIKPAKDQTTAKLETLVDAKIKQLEREKARKTELEQILKNYYDQSQEIINQLRSHYESLGFNNDQIRGEILRLNERHEILISAKSNKDIEIDFLQGLNEWIEKENPSNALIRDHINEHLEKKEKESAIQEPIEITQTIYIKSSEKMSEVPDLSIHLIVTSPPYWNKKDYGTKNQIGFDEDFEQYIERLSIVFHECARILVPSGRLCINVGDAFVSTEEYGRYKVFPIHARLINACESFGLDYMNTIVWQKIGKSVGTGGISGGVFGSYPFPPNGIINNDIEYILIFKKPGERDLPPEDIKILDHFSSKEEWIQHFAQVWSDIRPASQKKGHPAVFPDELPRKLIRMFTFHGETVLDPFLGTGTTCKVAYEMQRKSIGYEINSKFVALIKEKCPDSKIVDSNGKVIQNYI